MEEGRRVIEASWDRLNENGEGASDRAILLVRLHVQLSHKLDRWKRCDRSSIRPFDRPRTTIASGSVKPDLAIRAGSHDEAARWLDACVRRRPGYSRLASQAGLGSGDSSSLPRGPGIGHLPVGVSVPAQVQRLKAWLAAYRDDLTAERRALDELVAIEPTDFAAIDRLVAYPKRQLSQTAQISYANKRSKSSRPSRQGTETRRAKSNHPRRT